MFSLLVGVGVDIERRLMHLYTLVIFSVPAERGSAGHQGARDGGGEATQVPNGASCRASLH